MDIKAERDIVHRLRRLHPTKYEEITDCNCFICELGKRLQVGKRPPLYASEEKLCRIPHRRKNADHISSRDMELNDSQHPLQILLTGFAVTRNPYNQTQLYLRPADPTLGHN